MNRLLLQTSHRNGELHFISSSLTNGITSSVVSNISENPNPANLHSSTLNIQANTLFFFIRTSNFDAEAERSYIFWRFEAETFLKMFLNLPGIVFQPISADVTRQTIKEHFLLRYGIKLLAHTGLTCSDATCEMSRQPTLAKFGFKKRIDHRGLQQDINLLDFVAKTPKKFTCSTCSKAFINQQGLSVHVKCVHGVEAEGKILAKSSDSTPKTESENEIQTAVSSTMDKILSLVAEESSSSEKGNTNM